MQLSAMRQTDCFPTRLKQHGDDLPALRQGHYATDPACRATHSGRQRAGKGIGLWGFGRFGFGWLSDGDFPAACRLYHRNNFARQESAWQRHWLHYRQRHLRDNCAGNFFKLTMSIEAKCDCQRCGDHIAFPPEMDGQDITCPHCGRETTLCLPKTDKTNPDSNAPMPQGEQKPEMSGERMLLFGILGIVAVAVPLILFIHHQDVIQQRERNWQRDIDPKPTFVELQEAKIAAQKEHYEYLHWQATNGIPEGEYAYATNLLTDASNYPSLKTAAIDWLKKSADQGYQPAIDLLAKLPGE